MSRNNLAFLQQIGAPSNVLTIDNKFFFYFMNAQGTLAFILTAFVGPGLISSDLSNGALRFTFVVLSRAQNMFSEKPPYLEFYCRKSRGSPAWSSSSFNRLSRDLRGCGITSGSPAASSSLP